MFFFLETVTQLRVTAAEDCERRASLKTR